MIYLIGTKEENEMTTKLDYQLADLLSVIINRLKSADEKELSKEEIREFIEKHEQLLKN